MERGKKKAYTLRLLSDIPIVRYIKIKKGANPFDASWDAYFEHRHKMRLYGKRTPKDGILVLIITESVQM